MKKGMLSKIMAVTVSLVTVMSSFQPISVMAEDTIWVDETEEVEATVSDGAESATEITQSSIDEGTAVSGAYEFSGSNFKLVEDIVIPTGTYLKITPDDGEFVFDLNNHSIDFAGASKSGDDTKSELMLKLIPDRTGKVTIKNGEIKCSSETRSKSLVGIMSASQQAIEREIVFDSLVVGTTTTESVNIAKEIKNYTINGGTYNGLIESYAKIITIDGNTAINGGLYVSMATLNLYSATVGGVVPGVDKYIKYEGNRDYSLYIYDNIKSSDPDTTVTLGKVDGSDSDITFENPICIRADYINFNHFTIGSSTKRENGYWFEAYKDMSFSGGVAYFDGSARFFINKNGKESTYLSNDEYEAKFSPYFERDVIRLGLNYCVSMLSPSAGPDTWKPIYFNYTAYASGSGGSTGGSTGGDSGSSAGVSTSTVVFKDKKGNETSAKIITRAVDSTGKEMPVAIDVASKMNVNTTKNVITFAKAKDMPVVDGYTFKGWYNQNNKKISKITAKKLADMTVSATYVENTYSVTYKLIKPKGTSVTGKPVNKKKIKYSENFNIDATVCTAESKTGDKYTLIGWSKTKNQETPEFTLGQTQSKLGGKDKKNKKVVLYPVWKKN